MGAENRLAEDTLGQGQATTQTEWAAEGTGKYEHREMAAARANPLLLCVNESNIVEVRALPPQRRPH